MNMEIQNQQRLMSLDALRGFDMLFIMGFASLVISICNLFPGGSECCIAQNMIHVKWHGLTHHDTIFPLFLFIAGISWPYSYSKQLAAGADRKHIYIKVLKRAVILIIFGIIYNGLFKLDFQNMRICSVLGRIGAAWGIAACMYILFNARTRAYICIAILLGYWALISLVPAPDVPGADPLTKDGNLIGYIDRMITPGKLISNNGRFDPEGLLSTIPAIVTAMLGMFTGEFVRNERKGLSGSRKALYMFAAAVLMLVIGLVWNQVFPINKKMWTSSFVMTVGAYSLAMFALFYYVIDVKKCQKWTLFFRVIGMNSITIYMAQKILGFKNMNNFFFAGLASKLPEQWADVVINMGYVAICWLFLYFLYRKKIFLKV